ncbi:unnamed protein product [Meloidogyne enterolobii]|uniref:Uncharacterized protein n=1 Tax=Meloidogyne enterolobii TaxID=390850 RepID=A0ACB0ZNT6_MELEN
MSGYSAIFVSVIGSGYPRISQELLTLMSCILNRAHSLFVFCLHKEHARLEAVKIIGKGGEKSRARVSSPFKFYFCRKTQSKFYASVAFYASFHHPLINKIIKNVY